MIISNADLLFKFLGLELLFTLISWPFSSLFFHNLSDRGFSAAKILGWIATSYLLFLFSTLKIISFQNFWPIIVAWGLINLLVEIKTKFLRNHLLKIKLWVGPQILFTLIFVGWAWLRSHQPEIYQIERFMDFGIMKSLLSSTSLPLYDFWSSGDKLNYYYFGHIIGTSILRFTQIDLISGFVILVCWGIATLGANVFSLAKTIGGSIRGGFLSLFAVCFSGTAYSLYWIKNGGEGWYAEPTRAIAGTIMEFPVYSFLVADNHAHVWGLFISIIFLANLYQLWQESSIKNTLLAFFLLGISFITNTWDFAFLSIPLSVLLIIKKRFLYFSFYILTFVLVLPWLFFYKPPVAGIGLVSTRSNLLLWVAHWGFLLLFPIINLFFKRNKFVLLIFTSAVFILSFIEIFYLQDILKNGEWFRANTTFKATIQVWLWLGLIFGPAATAVLSGIKSRAVRIGPAILLVAIISIGCYYPYKAFQQSVFGGRQQTGIDSGLKWWIEKYPSDYQAYVFLNKIPGSHVILEAEGESYTDTSRFSTFLGWPTVAGWAVHEWTWNGIYDPIGKRGGEVRDVYIGNDLNIARNILGKYKVEYIIIGQVERDRYKNSLKEEKLLSFGEIIFSRGDTKVVKVYGQNRSN